MCVNVPVSSLTKETDQAEANASVVTWSFSEVMIISVYMDLHYLISVMLASQTSSCTWRHN